MLDKNQIEKLRQAAKSGGKNSSQQDLLNSLSGADKEKVMGVLNDPEKLNELLSSQRAKELMRQFGIGQDKPNG